MDFKLPRQEPTLDMQSADPSTSHIKSVSELASKPLATARWYTNGQLLATLNTQGDLTVLDVDGDDCHSIASRVTDFSESETQNWFAYCQADDQGNQQLVISELNAHQRGVPELHDLS